MRWVFLLIGLAGCAAPSPADWHGDCRFTEAERTAIESGEAWLARHAHREPATFDWTYEVTSAEPLAHTIRRERGPHAPDECEGFSPGVGGTTVYLGLDDPSVRALDVEGLAAHELAHCELGFIDDPDTDGIMRVITPMRWTDREEAQVPK